MNDNDTEHGSHRKVFGAGMAHGLKLAGITQPEDFMKQAKLERLLDKQTTIAKRVFHVTPAKDPWSTSRIHSELTNQGHQMQIRQVTACLHALKDDGLIKMSERGRFKRVIAAAEIEPAKKAKAPEPAIPRPPEEPIQQQEITPEAPEPVTTLSLTPKPIEIPETDPTARLINLAAEMRDMSLRMDEAVLEFEQLAEQRNKDLIQLAKMKELMKSFAE